MIQVSTDFTTNTGKSMRIVIGKVEVDWNLDGTFTDESSNQLVVEVERKVNEPLGGVNIGVADIELDNSDDRYTPPIE